LKAGAAHEPHPATAADGRTTLVAAKATKSAEQINRDMWVDLMLELIFGAVEAPRLRRKLASGARSLKQMSEFTLRSTINNE
jgi:hypothetical protein